MKKYIITVKRFLALVTPAIATSILATSPSQAATIAYSESTFNINNFSSSPLNIRTLTNTVTEAISTGGQVSAEAKAEAKFNVDINDSNNSASNWSFSQAEGQGYGYIGSAKSLAAIIGYDFTVDEKFSFDFSGLFKLETSIDDAFTERANAYGELSYQLYDSDSGYLLDSFNIFGNLSTLGNNDAFVVQPSSSITLDLNQTSVKESFGGRQEYASTSFKGKYSRTFDKSTRLTLVEFKNNHVNVYTVPEPSTILGSLFSCTILGAASISKRKKASSAGLLVNKD